MTHPTQHRAGVIDIGSNTIKILVGERNDGEINILVDKTVESRISAGMEYDPPRLNEKAMEDAVEAVSALVQTSRTIGSFPLEVVATSAVRDAVNRRDFALKIKSAVGLPLVILTGEEEARGIGRGIGEEPGLDPLSEYTVTDLGGGSLEWIHSQGGEIATALSFDLGAVRLLHRFVQDPDSPLRQTSSEKIRNHCRSVFEERLQKLPPVATRTHWGTGGAFTITRLLMATAAGRSFSDQPREIPVSTLADYAAILGDLPLTERKKFPGLPATRADILPVALHIIVTLAEFTGATFFNHSFNNLRMGRLALLLERNAE